MAGFLLCLTANGVGQDSASQRPYDDADAYQIYGLLLSHGEALGEGTLVIQQQTISKLKLPGGFANGPEDCLFPNAASEFADAIKDYDRLNQQHWLLQRKFQTQKSYELVSSEALKLLPKQGFWKEFYKRYPG